MDVEEALERAERLIQSYSRRHALVQLPYDDMCQELRMAVIHAAEKFDPDLSSFNTYVHHLLRFRVIDLKRTHGRFIRSGNQRVACFFSELEGDGDLRVDVAETYPDGVESVDFADVVEVAASRGEKRLDALLMWLAGKRNWEIAEHFGMSRQQISNWLAWAVEEAGALTGD